MEKMSQIKLNKTEVTEYLQRMQKMIDVSLDDLKAFEKVAGEFLTDQNVAASKTLKKLKEKHEQREQGRKKTIENAVTNLGTGKALLTEYTEAFEM
jgi:hypothetical protein